MMRIVIVEDEANTREGLFEIIVQAGHEVVACAADGVTGIEAVKKHRPELVISDIKMPGMDGLQMLEQLSSPDMEFQAILLTGYPEFEYARKAVKLGVVEYILKPLVLEELLEAIARAEDRLKKRSLPYAPVEQIIHMLFTSPDEEKARFRAMLAERLKMGSKDRATLFLLRPGSIDNETATEMQYRVNQSLNAFYMEDYYISRLPSRMGILVILMGTENYHDIKNIFRKRVLPLVLEAGCCACGMSPLASAGELEGRLKELDALLKYSFSFDHEIIDKDDAAGHNFQKIEYPEDIEHAIRKAIRCAEYGRIGRLGEQFCERVIESEGSPEYITEYTARFASSILYAVEEWSDPAYRGEHCEFQTALQKILDSQSRQELTEQMNRVLDVACGGNPEQGKTENAAILKVIAYIRNNYDQDIMLTDAAALIGFTPEYLSKLFFQEIGVNFVVFLRNFRISVAKRMLLDGNYKIHEVAERTGFNDPKYFNKIFKSVCGVSPSEYKKEGAK